MKMDLLVKERLCIPFMSSFHIYILRKKEVDTYSADPGRMLMEEMCELEREQKEANIRRILTVWFLPTQAFYTIMCHQGKEASFSVHFLSHVHCKKNFFFFPISWKGHRKHQEGQEVGIWEELRAGWLSTPINKLRHARNACLHNTSWPLLVSTRVWFWGRNK